MVTSSNLSPADAKKLAAFAITFLLVSPSDLDTVKGSTAGIKQFLIDAGIVDPLQNDLLNFVQAIAQDNVLVQQMQVMQAALLKSTTTSGIYDTPPCPNSLLSREILKRLAQP